MEDVIPTFVAITGATPDVARGFLELNGGDFERAVALFYESPDLVSGVGAGAASSAPAPPNPRPTRSAGREDASGVIHIDSDDDDEDMQFVDDDSDRDDSERATAMQAAHLAQEEEDAAMAKRLQEELYSENSRPGGGPGLGDDDVRAPIARTTETLVAPDPAWGTHDDGLENAFLEQMRQRRPAPPRGGGPFSQRIWGDPVAPETEAEESQGGSHAQRLEQLFRPPYDLMARMPWDEARAVGKEDKKWIMVNLQDMNDFNCQALNRDVWKDKAVHDLVSENFLFLQYDKDYPDAEEYLTFYFPNQSHENAENYPHVSIIDPRTGEQVKVWSGRPFPPAPEFLSDLAEFLDRYSLAANSKNPVAKAAVRKPQPVDVDRMTEDEMLEMALKNSLAASGGDAGGESSRSGSTPNIHDPDALTKTPAAGEAADTPAEEPAAASPFALISSTNPHVEPDNNPATTTRIQFRHPTGRVIRRFNLQDPVRRIYEWLKAEPLEGKEGVEFELKKMPQGQDLVDALDETVEASGLKQGTVMVEFLED